MKDRFKFRVAEFSDKDRFIQFSYYELGDEIYGTLCGHNSEPQMCTGLKDKNGKLIYEGDIVKIPEDWGEYGMMAGEIREVIYNYGGFRLKPKWRKNARGNYVEDEGIYEILGNIYENPEFIRK